ncbi:MAG: YraN family protein [Desulfocucumaceae bacterium]
MTQERITLGRAGEDAAVKYLKKKGMRVLHRNYWCRLGEIDIVAMDGPYMVFVEVRTKAGGAFGLAQESITKKKIHKIRQVASCYIQWQRVGDIPLRIDVVAVLTDLAGSIVSIDHILNAL